VDYWYVQRKSERVVRFGENGQKPAKGDCPAKLFSKVLPISAHGYSKYTRSFVGRKGREKH
jgi:1,6-anhydro-N-acetylmuramate kinase